jgi:hypothetical protein
MKHLPSHRPLSLLDDHILTNMTLMNLREFRKRYSGILPKGMPACLAFSTDRIRYLLQE